MALGTDAAVHPHPTRLWSPGAAAAYNWQPRLSPHIMFKDSAETSGQGAEAQLARARQGQPQAGTAARASTTAPAPGQPHADQAAPAGAMQHGSSDAQPGSSAGTAAGRGSSEQRQG